MIVELAENFGFIVLGLAPSFIWLVFYMREDFRHPEPKRLIALTFLLGGLVTFLVLPVQLAIHNWLTALNFGEHSFAAFLVLGFIEEIFKFSVVYFFIHRTLAFNEPIDAMLYLIVAGLGFAAAENIASIFRAAGGAILTATVVETLAMRFVGATLLHTIASGTVGYYWGRAFLRRGNTFVLKHRREFGLIAIGLLTATALHAVFNYLIILSGPASFAIVFIISAAFVLLHDFERLKREDVL